MAQSCSAPSSEATAASAPAPLRLVQLAHGYPPTLGGVEFLVRDLCEDLTADYGFQVTVVTTTAFSPVFAHLPRRHGVIDETANGVRVLRYPASSRLSLPLRLASGAAFRLHLPDGGRLRTWYNGPIAPGMARAARRLPADVVCAAAFPLNHMTYAFRRRDRPPVVLIGAIHTDDAWGFHRSHFVRLVNRSYATIAFTEHERDWLMQRGAKTERVRVIPLGIDKDRLRARPGGRERLGIPSDACVVGYVGKHAPHKGLEILIKTAPDLIQRCPSAFVVIAGGRTEHTAELRRRASRLPPAAAARVRIVDDLTDDAKGDVLSALDVFVSLSAAESFGLTTLEAWAMGRPTVLSDTPTQRCVAQDGVSALLVPRDDRLKMVAAVEQLCSDPDLRRRIAAGGRARLLERYQRQDMVRAFARLFADAAAAGRRR